jgi:hypothetical protein
MGGNTLHVLSSACPFSRPSAADPADGFCRLAHEPLPMACGPNVLHERPRGCTSGLPDHALATL